MPLQCIVFSGSTCSQSAVEVILVSNEADLRADSNDSSPMGISCKITKLFKLFLHRSEREHTIDGACMTTCLPSISPTQEANSISVQTLH